MDDNDVLINDNDTSDTSELQKTVEAVAAKLNQYTEFYAHYHVLVCDR